MYPVKWSDMHNARPDPMTFFDPMTFLRRLYLCQQLGGYRLSEIMTQFGLLNIGSVSFITSQIRKNIKDDCQLKKQIQQIKTYIIKNAT